MKKNNGFSLSEAIIAMGVILMLVATALPIYHILKTKHYETRDHQLIKLALHDELQEIIWTNKPLDQFKRTIVNRNVDMAFRMENEYVKGCALWENVREKKEEVCLYGIKEM